MATTTSKQRSTRGSTSSTTHNNYLPPSILTQSDSEDEDFEKMLDYQPFSQESSISIPTTDEVQETPPQHTTKTNDHACANHNNHKHNNDKHKSPPPQEVDTTMAVATRKVQNIPFPLHIQCTNQLSWHCITRRAKKKHRYYPCRICNKDEAIGLDIPSTWDPTKYVLIQYIGTCEPNLRQLVLQNQVWNYDQHVDSSSSSSSGKKNTKRKLIRITKTKNSTNQDLHDNDNQKKEEDKDDDGGDDDNNNDNDKLDDSPTPPQSWCSKTMKAYVEGLKHTKKYSALEIKIEELFLQRLVEHVHTLEKNNNHKRSKQVHSTTPQEPLPKEDTTIPATTATSSEHDSNDDDNDDDDIIPLQHKKEPLRVGDVIEYTNIIFVAGSTQGLTQATILSVNPKREPILVLDNGEYLEKDHPLKRIQYKHRNKIVSAPQARMRPLESFILRKSKDNLTFGAGLRTKTKHAGQILRHNMKKLKEQIQQTTKNKDGGDDDDEGTFAPMDILNRYKGMEKDNDDDDDDNANKNKENNNEKGKDTKTTTRTQEEEEKDHGGDTYRWKRKLEDQLCEMEKAEEQQQQSSRKRRRRTTTCSNQSRMTKEQIQLALDARQRMMAHCTKQNLHMEDFVRELAGQWDISDYSLDKFLKGDEQKLISLKQHAEIEQSLRIWMSTPKES